jgi:F-type H+-transporting ATPase subunit b
MPALAQEHAPAAGAAEEHAAEAEHASPFSGLFWPTANFAIMVGVLVYFVKPMITTYLADRSTAIRKDLVEAAALKATATEQLAAIERKLQALPGELDALRKRGADEIASEDQRIAAAAAADRDRLLAQARHEIDLQVRLAKREILEHAADLSVQLATERLKTEITPADQARLVDQYLSQVKDRT